VKPHALTAQHLWLIKEPPPFTQPFPSQILDLAARARHGTGPLCAALVHRARQHLLSHHGAREGEMLGGTGGENVAVALEDHCLSPSKHSRRTWTRENVGTRLRGHPWMPPKPKGVRWRPTTASLGSYWGSSSAQAHPSLPTGPTRHGVSASGKDPDLCDLDKPRRRRRRKRLEKSLHVHDGYR